MRAARVAPARAASERPALRLVSGGRAVRAEDGVLAVARAGVAGATTPTGAAGKGLAGRLRAVVLTGHAARTGADAASRRDATRIGALAATLTGFGAVMILAASPAVSIAAYGTPFSLFERQLLWIAVGTIAYAIARRVDLRRIRRLARPALVVSVLLLLVVLVPHLGKTAGGSSRWIGAGPLRLQPSELAKLAFALFCADLVARRQRARDQLRAVLRPLALVAAVAGILIVKQPDLGTAIVVVAIATAVLYAGGVERRLVGAFAGMAMAGGGVLALVAPYRRARLLSFVNPFAHATTSGYQVVQSLAALGSGHVAGAGVGSSPPTWFLPNAETDFIYAVVGHDLGLVGALAVLAAFVWLAVLGLRVAARSSDRFASLLVTGITGWVAVQAIVNIGGVIGALPETGIPLPFLSSGGSSLVVLLAAVGLVVNVGRHPRVDTEPSVASRRNGLR